MDGFYNIRKLVSECGVDDPDACLQWCQRIGLLPETRACSKCRKNMTLSSKRDGTAAGMRWWCRRCSKEVSPKRGTAFEESRLPLGQALLLIHCSVNRFSYEDAIREARMGDSQLSRNTIAHWYKICREACVDWMGARVNDGKMGVLVPLSKSMRPWSAVENITVGDLFRGAGSLALLMSIQETLGLRCVPITAGTLQHCWPSLVDMLNQERQLSQIVGNPTVYLMPKDSNTLRLTTLATLSILTPGLIPSGSNPPVVQWSTA